jgi:hypothetical protein
MGEDLRGEDYTYATTTQFTAAEVQTLFTLYTLRVRTLKGA